MPMQWVEPEIAIVANGVTVYRCYDQQLLENPHSTWFRVSADEEDTSFSIVDWRGHSAERSPLANVEMACRAGAILPVPDDKVACEWCGLQDEATR